MNSSLCGARCWQIPLSVDAILELPAVDLPEGTPSRPEVTGVMRLASHSADDSRRDAERPGPATVGDPDGSPTRDGAPLAAVDAADFARLVVWAVIGAAAQEELVLRGAAVRRVDPPAGVVARRAAGVSGVLGDPCRTWWGQLRAPRDACAGPRAHRRVAGPTNWTSVARDRPPRRPRRSACSYSSRPPGQPTS